MPSSLSTWEDLDYLRQQFPRAAFWGHPGAQGGGGVRNGTRGAVLDDEQEASVPGATGGRPVGPGPKVQRCMGRSGITSEPSSVCMRELSSYMAGLCPLRV